jgi:hypothetical protein
MEENWWVLGTFAICAAIILVYLKWKNLKDEKELIKSFNGEIKPEKHETDDGVI